MKFLKVTALVGASMIAAPAAMASTIMIDDFDVFQRVQDVPNGGFSNNDLITGQATIFGGSRELSVTTTPNNGTQPIGGSVLESTGAGGLPVSDALTFSNSSGQTGLATVVYDGNGGGLGDLTNGGLLTKFFFEVLSADISGTIFTTTVVSNTGTGTFTENVGATFNPFLEFSEADFAGVNFGNVTSLTFTFNSNGVDSFDGTLGSISIVPLPLSALLLLGGLGGLAGASSVSKRRRKG